MKKALILFTFLFVNFLQAQESIDVSLFKSEVFKEKKDTYLNTIFKDDGNNLYIIRSLENDKKMLIDVYTKDFKKLQSFEHKLKRRHRIAGAFLENNLLGFVEYFRNKKEDKIEAFLYTSDKDKLNFSKKKIFEVSTDSYPNFFDTLFSSSKIDKNFRGNMSVSKSANYYVFNIDSSDKKTEKHTILVFDRDFNKIWEKDIELPYDDRKFKLQDVIVSDNGEVYLLGKVYPKKKRKKKKGGKYNYELFKITQDNSVSKKFEVEDHFVASLELNFNTEDNISLIGFYSNRNEHRFKGVCAFIANPNDLSVISKEFSPFTEQFLTDKYGKKKDKELRNIVFKNISYTNNGDMIITAEEYFVTQVYTHNQFGGFSRTYYNFDDIIILKLDKKGKLIWARNINKAQTSGYFSNPLMSYGSVQYNNNEYLLLNAHKKMGELSGGRIKFRESFLWKATKRNTNLYIVKVDENGDFTYKTLLKNKDEKTPFNCRFVEQISENELILFGERRRKKQFLKITLN